MYLAIPLQKGQISCRELMNSEVMLRPCDADQPIMIDMIDSPYADNENLKRAIYDRGLGTNAESSSPLQMVPTTKAA